MIGQGAHRSGSDRGHRFVAFDCSRDPKKALVADRSPRLVIQIGKNDNVDQFVFVFKSNESNFFGGLRRLNDDCQSGCLNDSMLPRPQYLLAVQDMPLGAKRSVVLHGVVLCRESSRCEFHIQSLHRRRRREWNRWRVHWQVARCLMQNPGIPQELMPR